MNFLAHLHLAEATPESRLGNLLGDFVKGRPWDRRFSPGIWQGIVEHRRLDAFTDQHPAWRASRERLVSAGRRVSGIAVDLFYDFFLSRAWGEVQPGDTLPSFVRGVHRDLVSLKSEWPEGAMGPITRMIDQEWLLGYGTLEGIRLTLRRVARRSPALVDLEGMESVLQGRMEELERDFREFYPEVMKRAKEIREERSDKFFVT